MKTEHFHGKMKESLTKLDTELVPFDHEFVLSEPKDIRAKYSPQRLTLNLEKYFKQIQPRIAAVEKEHKRVKATIDLNRKKVLKTENSSP